MALYPGFCGPSNPSQSLIANCERTVNWMLERVESPFAPTGAAMYPTPGQSAFLTTADIEPAALRTFNGRSFAVIGTGFYEFFSNGTSTLRDRVAQDANPATISYNGVAGGQLFITAGGNGYNYDLGTNTLTQVLTGDATMGGMLNARFLAFSQDNGRVRFSGLNDGTSWDANDYFSRSQAPDPWRAMLVKPPEIWLIGDETGEVWYDTGAFPQPFAPIAGAFFKYGTQAPFSVAEIGDYLVWLSSTRDGAGRVVAARGYTPQPISNFAVESAITRYAIDSSITDCEVLGYEDRGHTFACFSFPTAGATWVCDLAMDMAWHERGVWDAAAGRFRAWGPRCHTYAFNTHLVANRGSGAIAALDVAVGSELNGDPIRRLRIPPPLWTNGRRMTVSRLAVLVEPGLGTATGQGSDPQVMLRTSRDAKTWGAERMAAAGAIGEYTRRCVFTRCGSSDTLWVPEITVSDPIPWRLSGADILGQNIAFAGKAA